MQPNRAFVGLSKSFWANIRTLSQKVRYTIGARPRPGEVGPPGSVKVPTLVEIKSALESISLRSDHLVGMRGKPTRLGRKVLDYYEYRADVLNRIVEPNLMNADQARQLFDDTQRVRHTAATVPMNKQSGEMKKPAYFTGIVNMLLDANLDGLPCNYNPQELTTITRNREPFRTLARRIDGAFPGPVDPLAVWEIKEYYYTTTFGSRVADGVYETLLDGMELEELDSALRELAKHDDRPTHIRHYLMIDAHYTWWIKGRSYLCRIIDMLHMGYVDEVLFGKEVTTRIPEIAREWVAEYRRRGND